MVLKIQDAHTHTSEEEQIFGRIDLGIRKNLRFEKTT